MSMIILKKRETLNGSLEYMGKEGFEYYILDHNKTKIKKINYPNSNLLHSDDWEDI